MERNGHDVAERSGHDAAERSRHNAAEARRRAEQHTLHLFNNNILDLRADMVRDTTAVLG